MFTLLLALFSGAALALQQPREQPREPHQDQLHDPLGAKDTPARLALRTLDTTNAYKPASTTLSLHKSYYDICAEINQACVDWLARNQTPLKLSLPNNPQYWHSFWSYLATGPAGANRFHPPGLPDPTSSSYANFFEAMQTWYLPSWLQQGQLDVEKTETVIQRILYLWTQAPTLMDYQVFLGAVGIAQVQLNLALATAANAKDRNSFTRLRKLIRPFTDEERSLRTALTGELKYAQAQIALMPKNLEELQQHQLTIQQAFAAIDPPVEWPTIEDVSQRDIDLEREEHQAQVQALEQLFAALIAISEDSSERYWVLGEKQFASLQELASHDKHGAWEYYIDLLQESFRRDLYNHVLLALAVAYGSKAELEAPSTPAPTHWQWEWRTASQTLCLTPASLQSSLLKSGIEACLPYLKIQPH